MLNNFMFLEEFRLIIISSIFSCWYDFLFIFVIFYLIFMLTRTIKQAFSFNILNAFKELKDAVRAPVKHIKALTEPTGNYYNNQTNTT